MELESKIQNGVHSWREVLGGKQRVWTTLVAAVLATIPPLLGGYTLGYSSPTLPQLNDDTKQPLEYHLTGTALALFAVSN